MMNKLMKALLLALAAALVSGVAVHVPLIAQRSAVSGGGIDRQRRAVADKNAR